MDKHDQKEITEKLMAEIWQTQKNYEKALDQNNQLAMENLHKRREELMQQLAELLKKEKEG